MLGVISNKASDAAQQVADSLNQGDLTGWDLLAAAVVVALTLVLSRLAARTIRQALRKAGIASPEVASDLGRVTKWLVYLLGIALAAGILGLNVGFLSVLFVFALVIGALAIKPMIENTASGILLVARPHFSVGDQIMTSVYRGSVESIGARSTTLRQSDGVLVYISNNQVLGNPIMVYSSTDGRKASFDIEVRPSTDLDAITSAVTTAIRAVDHVLDDPAPAVEATGITNNAITLSISYWYPSTMSGSSAVTDGAIRATMSALSTAEIELSVPDVNVTGLAAPHGASGDHPPEGGGDHRGG